MIVIQQIDCGKFHGTATNQTVVTGVICKRITSLLSADDVGWSHLGLLDNTINHRKKIKCQKNKKQLNQLSEEGVDTKKIVNVSGV